MQAEVTEGVKFVIRKHNQGKNLRIVVPEQNLPRESIPDEFLTEQDRV